MSNAAASPAEKAPAASKRLMSVDALRGFDMFWIIGADALVRGFQSMQENAATTFLSTQLSHCAWAGFRFYDLIFPLFVFISGVSIVFSLTKEREQHGTTGAFWRLFRRFLLLYIVGIFYSGGFSGPIAEIRWLGVLPRIALGYFFAGLIFLFCKPKVMAGLAVGLLAGYWALFHFAPIRDIRLQKPEMEEMAKAAGKPYSMDFVKEQYAATTARTNGVFEPGYNVVNHFDFEHLPGRKYDIYFDPEGILSTFPAIVSCLLGVFAGLLLRRPDWSDQKKLICLFSCGAAGVILGSLWSSPLVGPAQFPVVKKLWTSSFVLVTAGWSLILLGTFYGIVDVWKKQTWCQPFVWMGMNSITIYLASNFIGGFRKLGERLVGGDIKLWMDAHLQGSGNLLIAVAGLSLAFWFVGFLYKKKVFLRL